MKWIKTKIAFLLGCLMGFAGTTDHKGIEPYVLVETYKPLPIGELADSIANAYQVPCTLFRRLIYVESKWIHNSTSPKGAYGLTQLMPRTYRVFYKKLKLVGGHTEYNNMVISAYCLNMQFERYKRWDKVLAVYFTGEPDIKKAKYYIRKFNL